MDYIEVNNEVTVKSLETNRTPEVIGSVISRFQDVLDMVNEYLYNDMTILDLGTKDCMFFDVFKEYDKISFDVRESMFLVGIDCCPEANDICSGKGYEVYNHDVQYLTTLLENEKFDLIFIVHTLEHVPSPEKVVSECSKILKPNGMIFVEVPIQQYEDPELWGHYHTFNSQQKVKDLFNDYVVLKEDWQKTPSKKPWYRVLFRKGE